MTNTTFNALVGSIMKWDLICQGVDVDRGTYNCLLCDLFYGDWDPKSCKNCPVMLHTKKISCKGTPYDLWSKYTEWKSNITRKNYSFSKDYRIIYNIYKNDALEAAEKEVEFLISLLPDNRKARRLIERRMT